MSKNERTGISCEQNVDNFPRYHASYFLLGISTARDATRKRKFIKRSIACDHFTIDSCFLSWSHTARKTFFQSSWLLLLYINLNMSCSIFLEIYRFYKRAIRVLSIVAFYKKKSGFFLKILSTNQLSGEPLALLSRRSSP